MAEQSVGINKNSDPEATRHHEPCGKALFRPLKVGSITLKNRITMAALTRNRARGTYPSDIMKEYYVQRAGAGLIVSEGILISRQGYVYYSGIYGSCITYGSPQNRMAPSSRTLG